MCWTTRLLSRSTCMSAGTNPKLLEQRLRWSLLSIFPWVNTMKNKCQGEKEIQGNQPWHTHCSPLNTWSFEKTSFSQVPFGNTKLLLLDFLFLSFSQFFLHSNKFQEKFNSSSFYRKITKIKVNSLLFLKSREWPQHSSGMRNGLVERYSKEM